MKDGADSIAEVHYPDVVWPYKPTEQETKNLAAGIDEAQKLGVQFQVHAVSDLSMVDSVGFGAQEAGALGEHQLGDEGAGQGESLPPAPRSRRSPASASPNFDVFSQDNLPKFRDGKPWPEGIVDSQGVGQEAGYMPVNLRTLYDAGVEVLTPPIRPSTPSLPWRTS